MKFGFQRFAALLLLVTFAPLAILSEASHLIPGLSENCGCFKAVNITSSLHNLKNDCFHDHGSNNVRENADGSSAKFIEVEIKYQSVESYQTYSECLLHSFFISFNSFGIVIVMPSISKTAAELNICEFLSVSCGFYSLFQARAPPIV
ncbi:MAG: hypothetical protein LBE18_05445 [Planctomycetaceae bacterium]|nr:hypothetical protein [Planctomycetaceae bacterium]